MEDKSRFCMQKGHVNTAFPAKAIVYDTACETKSWCSGLYFIWLTVFWTEFSIVVAAHDVTQALQESAPHNWQTALPIFSLKSSLQRTHLR